MDAELFSLPSGGRTMCAFKVTTIAYDTKVRTLTRRLEVGEGVCISRKASQVQTFLPSFSLAGKVPSNREVPS